MLSRARAWWATARSSMITHRRLKWLWVALIPVAYMLRNSIAFLTFLSVYAVIVGHWSSEEAAAVATRDEDDQHT